MEYSTVLVVLKVVSFFSAIGFGALGIIKDSKKDGEVTKWGLIAVTGVIISGLISASSLFAEERAKSAEKQKADSENVQKLQKANEDKVELNNQFDKLVSQATENIKKTDTVLSDTKGLAESIQTSVGVQEGLVKDQKEIIEKTGEISENVKKNVNGQNQVLHRTEKIAQSLKQSVLQQQILVDGNNKLLGSMEIQLVSQNELMKNSLRSLAQLKTMGIAYTVLLNLDNDPDFKKYIDRLVDLVEKGNPPNPVFARESITSYSPQGMTVEFQYNKIQSFYFDESSGYFPSDENDVSNAVVNLFEKLSSEFTFNFNQKQEILEVFKKTNASARDRSDLVLAPSNNAKKTLTVEFNGDERNVYLSVFSADLNWIKNNRVFVGFVDLPNGIISVKFPFYKLKPINADWITSKRTQSISADLMELVLTSELNYGSKYCLSPDNMQHIPFNIDGSKSNFLGSMFIYQMHNSDFTRDYCEAKRLRNVGYIR